MIPMRISKALRLKLQKIRLLLCDVDGVLTDGGVYMGTGIELKRFHVWDGLGLRMLSREGIKIGWISNRESPATTQRARELKIDFLYQKAGSKVEAAHGILKSLKLEWNEACFIGDDIVDIQLLRQVGVGVAVANASDATKSEADCVTTRAGGQGAVREVVEAILHAKGLWETVLAQHIEGKPRDKARSTM